MDIRSYLFFAKKKPGFWVPTGGDRDTRNRVSVVDIRSYLFFAKKKPGFWGLLAGVEKPGFCCGYPQLSVFCEKETRFLGVYCGGRETGFLLWISAVICFLRKRNPVSGGFWGLLAGVEKPGFFCGYPQLSVFSEKETRFLGPNRRRSRHKKPGFCGGYQKLSVFCEKETRFLGVACGGRETGFLLWISAVICFLRKRNPVSGGFWGVGKDRAFCHQYINIFI
ncbi:hypothetical protein AM228_17650 [Planktothricoides sp. SR001]|uniref:hypothetical protein n=1 Tax=Planktothricoides sp. SR001 TaxID=1705388 RepID=UPI0006C37E4F|nr:hypothetical protein [Planktothricoides sp. SR001]KOR35517.1 hypothetical protein AM228_17650 [Planktothricoides sp. SR001]